jgi:tetratricopeptide (TPR) repeat protein
MSYYMMGEYGKSVEAYTKALRINEKVSATYNNLGMALGKLGRYDEAMNAFKRAGDEASAYNNLGMIYMADKKYEKALIAFEKAIELKPTFYVKASENMAKAKAAMKNTPPTP